MPKLWPITSTELISSVPSFFCSRDDGDCSNIGLVFPTIAYQLSLRSPSFQKHLSEAIEKDPDVHYALASMQTGEASHGSFACCHKS